MAAKLMARLKRDYTNRDVFAGKGDEKVTVAFPDLVRHPRGTICEVVLYGGEEMEDGFAHVLMGDNLNGEPMTFMDVPLTDLTRFKIENKQ